MCSNGISNWFDNSNLSLCSTLEHNTEACKKIFNYKNAIQCPVPEYDVQFNAVVYDDEYLSSNNSNESVYILLKPETSFRYVKKEVLIYDTANFVGSLGGSLGLFIGFSCFGTFTFLMNKMCKD